MTYAPKKGGIYIPMKMSNRVINWHGMGIMSYFYDKDKTKYLTPPKKYMSVILEYVKISKK